MSGGYQSGGYQTGGYGTQDDGLNASDYEQLFSGNGTMEITGGYRSSAKIPKKKQKGLNKSKARNNSVTNMHNRYGNDSKMKLDHTSFI